VFIIYEEWSCKGFAILDNILSVAHHSNLEWFSVIPNPSNTKDSESDEEILVEIGSEPESESMCSESSNDENEIDSDQAPQVDGDQHGFMSIKLT